jgi:hypothetical protein
MTNPATSLLCLCCGSTTEQRPGLTGCPSCGCSEHVPADLGDTLTVTLTRHELRILTFFATYWANRHQQSNPHTVAGVQLICDRLGTQTDTALTLGQEIADVRAAFPDSAVTVTNSRGEEVDL